MFKYSKSFQQDATIDSVDTSLEAVVDVFSLFLYHGTLLPNPQRTHERLISSESREEVVDECLALNWTYISIYLHLSKVQGTSQKRGQKESQSQREEKSVVKRCYPHLTLLLQP